MSEDFEELRRQEKHLRNASEELRKAGFTTTEPPRDGVQIALRNVMEKIEDLDDKDEDGGSK